MNPWWQELFGERYLEFYDQVLAGGAAEAEVEFIDRALPLRSDAAVLDLGCGVGRHAVPMAGRGYRVTGVELSAVMVEHARDLARHHEVELTLLRRDVRQLDDLGPFDACLCLYTVFGYFDDEGNEALLRTIRARLVGGGYLVLDVTNPLALMASWPGERWREGPSGVTRETLAYDPLTARLRATRRLYRTGGGREDLPPSEVRMYPPHELRALLRGAGFEVDQLHGGLLGQPFRWKSSPQQVWVVRASE